MERKQLVGFANWTTFQVFATIDTEKGGHIGWSYAKLTPEEWERMRQSDRRPWDWIVENLPGVGSDSANRLQFLCDDEAAEMTDEWLFWETVEEWC